MIRRILLLLTLATMLLSQASHAAVPINRVTTGNCPNGRTWVSNIEYESTTGDIICISGIRCDGSTYTNCPSGGKTGPQGSSTTIDNGNLVVVITGGSARVTVHRASDGHQVHDFGTVSGSASVPTSSIGSGNFTVAARDPSTDMVADANMITIP
jgi:hypothetical protein